MENGAITRTSVAPDDNCTFTFKKEAAVALQEVSGKFISAPASEPITLVDAQDPSTALELVEDPAPTQ